jgi:surfactin synthase thioesterase subunit
MTNSSTSRSVYVLPFAGGGAGFFRPWRAPGARVGLDVVPIQLPGREERFGEPLPTDAVVVAKDLAANVEARSGAGSLAVFGHSLGAVLAFELTRELLSRGKVNVQHLFVSGSPSPWRGRSGHATGLSDEEFLARVNEFAGYRHAAFDNPDLRALLLPVLRADVAMHESYLAASQDPIGVPITAIRGAGDQLVSRAALKEWGAVTSAAFDIAELDGGHMYLTDNPAALLTLFSRVLGKPDDDR